MSKIPFINSDYRHRLSDSGGVAARLLEAKGMLLFGASAALIATTVALLLPDMAEATRSEKSYIEPAAMPAEFSANALALQEPAPSDSVTETQIEPHPATSATPVPVQAWRSVVVKSGDSMAQIFNRLGLPSQALHAIMSLGDEAKALARIHPGDTLWLDIDETVGLRSLRYELDHTRTLEIAAAGPGYDAHIIETPLDVRVAAATGTIDSSLFAAAQQSGLSDALTMELANIFGWDIDFALDIRKGDGFTVLYEQVFRDGERLKDGAILAATFSNQGQTYRAVRYRDSTGREGYYTEDGRAMRKTFLRTPVEFTRISSTFSSGRYHPVLNRIRAHKGVDYAAPTGTPVKATGDGKVAFMGNSGGYGKTVIIQHGSQYTTLYAHLSRYARGMRNGARVRQGEVIGYVGQTGLATGPHLHYEFRVSGAHRNPLTVKFPAAEPLPLEERADFARVAQTHLDELNRQTGTAVALADKPQ